MASKKTSSSESTKKKAKTTASSNVKKTTTKASSKKTTTKKVEPKTASKKENTKTPVKDVKVEAKEVKQEKVTVRKENVKFYQKAINWLKENYVIAGLVVIAILLIINIIIVVNGHKVKLSDGKEIIASVDGKDFVAEDLFDSLKESYGSDALLNLVDAYIIEQELTDDEKSEAKEQAKEDVASIREQYETYGYDWDTVLSQYGYADEDAVIDEFLLSYEKEIVAKNYLKEQLTDDEIESYYNDNVYGTYTAKHILIVPDTDDDMSDEEVAAAEEEAKNKAQEVIDKLNNGEDWATLVSEYSEDEGSADDEGLVENFTKGDVVDEFWDAVVDLKDGEYTKEPVESSYGYHVIYRVSYEEKDSLDDMKDELIETIISNKLDEDSDLYTDTWVKIRKKYNFTINDTVIKKAYED
jgi:parvulin-like peptidyl-prolyl isomerase